MKVPYSVQGLFFAPSLIGLIFILDLTCSSSAGAVCFSDYLSVPMFLPAVFVSGMWKGAQMFAQYELLFILLYWCAVGFLVGLCFDIYREEEEV